MMGKPKLMTSVEWLQKTNRKAWHGQGDKERGGPLQLVDSYVAAYHSDKGDTPANLEYLYRFLRKWVDGKLKNGAIVSIREHQGAVSALLRQCEQAMTLWQPVASRYAKISIGADTYRGNAWVPDDFRGAVEQALDMIASKPIGKKLLADIGKACVGSKQVVIEFGGRSTAAPLAVVTNESRKKIQPVNNDDERYNLDEVVSAPELIATAISQDGHPTRFIPGAGTGTVVTFNHKDAGIEKPARPIFIALAHELVHAHHYASGMCYRAASGGLQDGGDTGLMEEEMRTVGCQKYADEVPSENAIRGEHGLPLRTRYSDISFDNVVATGKR
jgi:Effector protein